MKKSCNISPRWPLAVAAAILFSLAALLVVPGVYAKYVAQGTGSGTGRVAAFDIRVDKIENFGHNAMLYWHKGSQRSGTALANVPTVSITDRLYFIEATNASEVTVRVKLRFFNVLRDNGTIAAGYQWYTDPGSRRMVPPNSITYYLSGWNAPNSEANRRTAADGTTVNNNTAFPRFGNLRTANTSGTFYANTDRRFYNAATATEGAVMQPNETIRFYFDLSHELHRDANDSSSGSLIKNKDDFDGDGTWDAVFRINFDLIATQID